MLKRSRPASIEAPPQRTGESKASKSIIGLFAPKGGLGISTLAINLGVSLYEKVSEDVIVAEMQPGRGDISVYLGYNSSQAHTDLLTKSAASITQADIENALVSHPTGVSFLLASYNASDAIHMDKVDQMEKIVDHLSHIALYTILDLGSNLTQSIQNILMRCDKVIVAVESTPHTVEQAKSLLNELVKIGVNRMKISAVLLNRTRTEQALSISSVQKELGYDLSTIFTPAPELAHQAATTQKPMIVIDPESFTKQQVLKLIEVLT
jgi:pilus assembly protein CpaE